MNAPAVLVIQPGREAPIARLGQWLTSAGLQLDVRTPAAGDALPGSLDGIAALVVMGGAMSATDDIPWLGSVRDLLAEASRREVPTLGVCLGAQLLAVALGGRVTRNPEGPEYGAQLVAKRAASATDPLLRALPITPDVIQWHTDAVVSLPPGAVNLASSPGCEVQAFRAGRVAWGVQFHLETTPEIVRAWAAQDADALAGYDIERILQRSDAAHDDVAAAWEPFAAAFAAVVHDPATVTPLRPVIAATAAPVTDPAAIRAALAAEMTAARQGAPTPLPPPRMPPPRMAPSRMPPPP